RRVEGTEYNLDWFAARRGSLDWAHVHWPGEFYLSTSRYYTIAKAVEFVRFVLALRRMGLSVVWTLHNLLPQESRSRAADYFVWLSLARLARIVIVHSEYGRGCLHRYFFRRRDIVYVPHGHFVDWYRRDLSRQQARVRLGLPDDAFVYLLF